MRKALFCLIVLATMSNICNCISLADPYEEIAEAEAQGGWFDRFGPCVTEVVPENVRVVSVLPFEDETLVALWEAIAETDDNAFVFASADLPGLNQYELFDLFGTRIYGYDVAMGQLYVTFETDGYYEPADDIVALLGIIDDSTVIFSALTHHIPQQGTICIEYTSEQAVEAQDYQNVIVVLKHL